MKKAVFLLVCAGLILAGTAAAGTNVNANISGSDHWTKAGSPYHLKKQIYVLPGAALTIDAGVVVASFVDDQGSLAVCRGAKIYVNGTRAEPVIMTSAEDVATWTGSVVTHNGSGGTVDSITTLGDPKTGTWREGCNEWGNLTIMGDALISASHYGGSPVTINNEGTIRTNDKCPNGLNEKNMEGLVAAYVGDSKVLYGGDNDDDDSGEIHYISLRYGGKVIGLANELNGLSLGGLGRETDIDHVEIMNNVDDGIEIWGGTVNLKYVNIWNIGDDSFDLDEGWRGKAQFGLIVQGYSINASQGSGVGDNCFETDGAEDSDAQPVTTAKICNFTVIGQPVGGDHGTAWRDNARIQYCNNIWMELGEQLVKLDNVDGDGANGYGYNGTLSWADTWTTDSSVYSTVNLCGADPADLYKSQGPGKLAQITNSIFYNNQHASAYTEATNRNVLVRGTAVTRGGLTMLPVTYINPCAANDAVTSYTRSPYCNCKQDDEFFQPAPFAGGFSPYYNWLESWTAVDAYGMTDTAMNTPTDTSSMIVPDDGDLDGNGMVNMDDFAVFSETWLQ